MAAGVPAGCIRWARCTCHRRPWRPSSEIPAAPVTDFTLEAIPRRKTSPESTAARSRDPWLFSRPVRRGALWTENGSTRHNRPRRASAWVGAREPATDFVTEVRDDARGASSSPKPSAAPRDRPARPRSGRRSPAERRRSPVGVPTEGPRRRRGARRRVAAALGRCAASHSIRVFAAPVRRRTDAVGDATFGAPRGVPKAGPGGSRGSPGAPGTARGRCEGHIALAQVANRVDFSERSKFTPHQSHRGA